MTLHGIINKIVSGENIVSKRREPNQESIQLIQNEEWLRQKIEEEGYSSSRLAKELGIYRASVERYRVKFGIEQKLSQKELTAKNYHHKTKEQKQSILEKRKATNIELFGVENTFQSEEKKHKARETMLVRYGIEKALQSPDILERQQSTMLERYGVRFAVHNKTLYQKQLDTIYERYGDNPSRLEHFKKKAKQTCMERYGVPHAMMDSSIAALSRRQLLDLYTQEELTQKSRAAYHTIYNTPEKISQIYTKSKNTSKERYGVNYWSQRHLVEALPLLENKEWLINQHHIQKKTLTQIAQEIGCNPQTVSNYCYKQSVEIKYYFESAQQREVSDWLTSLDIIVHTNVRNKISRGELDIYLPEYKLAIEYCGVFWHSDAHERMTSTYHRDKMRKCTEQGIRLLTIYEDEWIYKKEIVKQKILSILKKNQESIFARKCSILQINDTNLKNTFFDANHIQGTGPGSITYGLLYSEKLVAMMTFIFRKYGKYELNRYATSVRVVGGFQKLLSYFEKHHDWTQIVSFADLRWSEGNMYTKSGFTFDKMLPPDYRYVIGNQTFHKFGFRRRALLGGKIPTFDPALSEVQNMKNAGYHRIWNCGLLRYVKSC